MLLFFGGHAIFITIKNDDHQRIGFEVSFNILCVFLDEGSICSTGSSNFERQCTTIDNTNIM